MAGDTPLSTTALSKAKVFAGLRLLTAWTPANTPLYIDVGGEYVPPVNTTALWIDQNPVKVVLNANLLSIAVLTPALRQITPLVATTIVSHSTLIGGLIVPSPTRMENGGRVANHAKVSLTATSFRMRREMYSQAVSRSKLSWSGKGMQNW